MKHFQVFGFIFWLANISRQAPQGLKTFGVLDLFWKHKGIWRTKLLRITNMDFQPCRAQLLRLPLLSQHHLSLPRAAGIPGPRLGKGKRKPFLTSFPGICPDRPPFRVPHPVLPNKWLWRFSYHGKCGKCLCQPVGGEGEEARVRDQDHCLSCTPLRWFSFQRSSHE